MSHLWPELLRITLCPSQVILERGKLMISFKGVEPRYSEPEIIPVEARHEPTLWDAPLAVLRIALDGLPQHPYYANVILSNYFVRYPLVRACPSGEPETALEAVDSSLQAALAKLLERHDCRLTSLLPRIVALSSNVHEELQGEPGWLVLIEEGLACLGLILNGEIAHLRSLYMWPASSVELLALLDREAAMAGLRQPPRNLLLWIWDESDDVTLPRHSDWQVTRLGLGCSLCPQLLELQFRHRRSVLVHNQ